LDVQADGYRVFRKGGGVNDFQAITELIPITGQQEEFVDSSGILSGRYEYTYAVRLEKPGSGISELSNAVALRPLKGNEIPAPAYLKAFPSKDRVVLFWEDMKRNDTAIEGYRVNRKNETKTGNNPDLFVTVVGTNNPFKSNTLTDSLLDAKNIYTYSVQATDKDQKSGGKASQITVSLQEDAPIAPVRVTANPFMGSVKLEWTPVAFPGFKTYNIYCSQPDNPRLLLKAIPEGNHEFIDPDQGLSPSRRYFIVCQDKSGKESQASELVGLGK
jgi:hypothetical protein